MTAPLTAPAPIAYGFVWALGPDEVTQLLTACELALALVRGHGEGLRLALDVDAPTLDALADALARGGRDR